MDDDERFLAEVVWAIDHLTSRSPEVRQRAGRILDLARARVEDWHDRRATGS